jgi:FAD synthase
MGKLLIDTDRSYSLSPKDEAILSREKKLAELEPDNVFIGIDYASGLFGDKSIKTKARLLDDGRIEVISVEEFDYEKDIPDTVISFRKKNVATINGSSKYLKKLLNEGEIKFIKNEELLKELNNNNFK